MMLKVSPNERPSCAQILKHPLVLKRIEFFQASANFENIDIDNMDEGELLKTIRIPKNILFLTDKLPEANYDNHLTTGNKMRNHNNNLSFPSEALPDIKLTKRSLNNDTTNSKIKENTSRDDNKSNNESIDTKHHENTNNTHRSNKSKNNSFNYKRIK